MTIDRDKKIQYLPFEVNVIVTQRQDRQGDMKPAVELRRVTTDLEIVKNIVSATFHNRALVILPRFTDRTRSIGTLIDKGIMYYDHNDGQYHWTI